MNELIGIYPHDTLTRAIDARELHAFLEVRSEFRNWIKNRIDQYGFMQDVDFIAGNFLPDSDRIDYAISLIEATT